MYAETLQIKKKTTVQTAYKVVRIQGMSAYIVYGLQVRFCICDETFIHVRNPLMQNFCFEGFLVPNLCFNLQLALTAR